MNEKLLEYLPDPNTVKGGLSEVVEILQREAPLLVQELINYNIVYHLGFQIVTLFIVVVCWCCVKKVSWCWAVENYDESDGLSVFVGIVIPIAAAVTSIAAFSCHFYWIKPLIAPRLFLLEYLSNLM